MAFLWYTISIIYREEETSLARRRKTHEEYVIELKEKGIQAEPLEPYNGAMTKIKHRWSCGHVTEIVPNNVLSGHGCGKCLGTPKKTHSQYLEELKKKGVQVEVLEPYVNNKTKIKHLWKACGHVTEVGPYYVLRGDGCGICCRRNLAEAGAKAGEKQRLKAAQELDKRVKEVHGIKVRRDPKTPYVNSYTKLSWLCDQAHQWEAVPKSIKQGIGCPQCATSHLKGETFTREVLEEYGIEFQAQKEFPDLKRINRLSYDFYIPSMDILIECQGEQHYKPVDFMGGAERFDIQQERDQLKREYAWQNGYYLLEISYKDYRKDRIKAILEDAGVLQKQPA